MPRKTKAQREEIQATETEELVTDAEGQEPEAEGEEPAADDESSTEDTAFDPADHTVEEVEEYLATADDDETVRVLTAEESGKARKSLLPDDEQTEEADDVDPAESRRQAMARLAAGEAAPPPSETVTTPLKAREVKPTGRTVVWDKGDDTATALVTASAVKDGARMAYRGDKLTASKTLIEHFAKYDGVRLD